MRLVKEEHHPGLFQIAHLGQALKELGEHPQQEGGVHIGALNQLGAGKDIDIAAAVHIRAHPVADVQGRFAKNAGAALILKGKQRTLNGADAGRGYIAIHRGKLGAVFAGILQHSAQILKIQQQQAMIVRHTEHDVKHARLDIGQLQQPRQQRRAHAGYRDAHGMTLLAKDIPEASRIGRIGEVFNTEGGDARAHTVAVRAGAAHAAQIALDVAEEHRHAHGGKGLGQHLHGDGFACARRAGDQTVAVGHLRQEVDILVGRLSQPDFSIRIHKTPPYLLLAIDDYITKGKGL